MSKQRLWMHDAIAGKHLVRMTRDYVNCVAFSAATCQCGWTSRETVAEESRRWIAARAAGRERPRDAVDDHWLQVVRKARETAA